MIIEVSKVIKIATVCGMGFGTSLLLKMNIDSLLKGVVEAEVYASDLATVKSMQADLIVATRDMENHLSGVKTKIIYLDSITDPEELKSKIEAAIEELKSE
jgi:PTS system ascorbate-specific IIB component